MKVLFLGSGAFGQPSLAWLNANMDIVGVVTQPDRKAGRGSKLASTPVSEYASGHMPGIEIFKPANVNDVQVRDRLRSLGADVWVVIAYGQKLSRELLEGVEAVNLHASLLPRWRGAAPINHAILAGDTITGNSVIELAERMDAGRILGQSTRPILPEQTAGELHDLLAEDGPELLERVLNEIKQGSIVRHVQEESLVTHAGKFSKADNWVDFGQAASVCRCRVHGLSPWPGVMVKIAGEPVKLSLVQEIDAESSSSIESQSGELIDPVQGLVACGQGSVLKLIKVQPSGKKVMGWEAFYRGRSIEAGTVLCGSVR